MELYTKYKMRGMIDKACKVASAAVLASAIFGAGMYAGAALYHKYRNPGRVYVPNDDFPNGDINNDGLYPDIILSRDGRLMPLYRLDWREGEMVYGDADEARFMNRDGGGFSKEDYDLLEKKLNDDFQRENGYFDVPFLAHLIRDWL